MPSFQRCGKAASTVIFCVLDWAALRRCLLGSSLIYRGRRSADHFSRSRTFFANTTLIEKHERQRKEKRGLKGVRRGADAAALDAGGAGLGSVALVAFALVVWRLATGFGVVTLAFAALVWFLVAVGLFYLRRNVRRLKHHRGWAGNILWIWVAAMAEWPVATGTERT